MDWKVLAIQPVVYTDFQNVELLHIYGLVPEQQVRSVERFYQSFTTCLKVNVNSSLISLIQNDALWAFNSEKDFYDG